MSDVTSPPRELVGRFLPVFRYLVPRLQYLSAVFPTARPTSWYRTRARNVAAGGAELSQHRLGFAVDWVPPRRADYERFARAARAAGLIAVVESDHVHTQVFRAGTLPRAIFPVAV